MVTQVHTLATFAESLGHRFYITRSVEILLLTPCGEYADS